MDKLIFIFIIFPGMAEQKQEAMLQMYGEKPKLNIDDFKTMYRQQVRKLFVVSVIIMIIIFPSLLKFRLIKSCWASEA